ncbi:MAG: sugar-binding transcriptional regulator [Aggregatilineales bacterium]
MNLSDAYVARLIAIARAYYLDNATQADIARMFNLSRSMVSRDLTLAREIGIVEISIRDPRQRTPGYQDRLRNRFPQLIDAVIAPTFSEEPDALRATLGRFAANYLLAALKPGQRLALGCGRTLRAMIDSLPSKLIPAVEVVQAMGNIGHEAHGIDYNEIARQAANALGGRVYYLSAPAILGQRAGTARAFTEANPTLSHALALAKAADIYVVGLGSLESDQLYAQAGLIEPQELEAVRDQAVGDICGHFFDLNGTPVFTPFHDRIVGITLEDLRHAAITIGVAGGLDKVEPLIGALRGGYINVVVSDERTIALLLERLDVIEQTVN